MKANLMLKTTLIFVLLGITAQAATPESKESWLMRLKHEQPTFQWQAQRTISTALQPNSPTRDFALGVNDKSVLLVMTTAQQADQLIEIPVNAGKQFGLCSAKKLTFVAGQQSEAPMNALGAYPDGYEVCSQCFEIRISDGECDPLNFYWNRKTNMLNWWRA